MSIKTKTTAAAAMAALAVPGAAFAHDGGKGKHDRGKSESRHAEHRDGKRGHHGSRGWHGRAFVVRGVSASGLTVTDGKLAGALTLDPTAANKGARRFLELSKTALRGTDTVSFGEAGDEVFVKYRGLAEGDALQPTDVVTAFGKVGRDGALDLKFVKVHRPEAEDASETKTASSREHRSERDGAKSEDCDKHDHSED